MMCGGSGGVSSISKVFHTCVGVGGVLGVGGWWMVG